ncbi:MAG: NAD(P)-dependent oxidoreductase [Candidatus Limnocylindria bacterium]
MARETALAGEREVIGFIGLGIMGRPMALNLVKAGHRLIVHSRSPGPVNELVAAGATRGGVVDIAARCDLVITMLPDTVTVEVVVRELAGGLRRGALIIDMSTIHPDAARSLATELAAKGIAFLDAPVSGGERGAIEGTLSVMVGGDSAELERAMPVLRAMSSRIVHVGGSSAGQVTKAVNQLVVVGTIQIVAEALVLAAKAGVSPAKVREALLGGFAQSRILDAHGERMLTRNFTPGARLRLHVKDAEVLGSLSRALGVPLPAFEAAAKQLQAVIDRGGIDLDQSALVTELERAAGIQLGG